MCKNDFKTINMGLNALLAPNNRWNSFAITNILKRGRLIDYTGHLAQTPLCVPLRNVCKKNGNSQRIDLQMAKSTQEELRKLGLRLDYKYFLKHSEVLVAVNTIVGLAYCSLLTRDKESRKSFLCTKNPNVIRQLCRQFKIVFPVDAMRKYQDRFIITEEEIHDGCLKCVKIDVSNGRVKLSDCKIHIKSKSTTLLPMFDVLFYNNTIVERLKRGVFDIKCRNSECITASLDMKIINNLGNEDAETVMKAAQSQSDMGQLKLYDLNSQEFVLVNILDIVSISRK